MEIAKALSLDQTICDFKSPMQHFSSDVHVLMHSDLVEGDISTKKDHHLTFGAGMVLATAANYAIYNKKYLLVWGATRDDAASGKFDYTQEFCDALAALITQTIGQKFSIVAPFAKKKSINMN